MRACQGIGPTQQSTSLPETSTLLVSKHVKMLIAMRGCVAQDILSRTVDKFTSKNREAFVDMLNKIDQDAVGEPEV